MPRTARAAAGWLIMGSIGALAFCPLAREGRGASAGSTRAEAWQWSSLWIRQYGLPEHWAMLSD